MWIINEKNGDLYSSTARPLTPRQIKSALSPLAWKILQELETPNYPKKIAKKLKVHEQKVYYHIKNMEKNKIIELIKTEGMQGALAKYYALTDRAFVLLVKDMEPSTKLFSMKEKHKRLLEPFIENGRLNALIVMGSPEPHGSAKVRAKDGPVTTNLGLFLGTFLSYIPRVSVKLDVEIKESDLNNNLILIGGPGVNSITREVNKKLPIRFKRVKYENNFYSCIHSTITKKNHLSEASGIVVRARNPFNKNKSILVIAGRRAKGTIAGMLALMNNLDSVCKGNRSNRNILARVVEGVDVNNDGIIDTVEFLE